MNFELLFPYFNIIIFIFIIIIIIITIIKIFTIIINMVYSNTQTIYVQNCSIMTCEFADGPTDSFWQPNVY